MIELREIAALVGDLERAVEAGDLGAIVNSTRRLRLLVLEAEVVARC